MCLCFHGQAQTDEGGYNYRKNERSNISPRVPLNVRGVMKKQYRGVLKTPHFDESSYVFRLVKWVL